jgi:acyl carrier protein
MTMTMIKRRVRGVIANALNFSPREIDMACDLVVDLGLNEADLEEIYEILADELDVVLDEEATKGVDTVQDLVDVLEDQLLE